MIRPGQFEWNRTHAQNPFPEHIGGDRYKIHFAGRDKLYRSQGGYVEIDMKRPGKVLYMTEKPTLELGELGCFDDCGVMPSCLVKQGNKQYMYYTGWTQQKSTPFSFFIGLAISSDNGRTFERYSKSPVLGRTGVDHIMTGSPWVIKENRVFRMWYVSGTGWTGEAFGKQQNHYHIRYAESEDGIEWKPEGVVCVDYKDESEYALARPVVFKSRAVFDTGEEALYRMVFSRRSFSAGYRGGYAESTDGIHWQRNDSKLGLDVSKTGWDSEMVCYPCIFEHKDKKYLLYNGNNYGTAGCGYAKEANQK